MVTTFTATQQIKNTHILQNSFNVQVLIHCTVIKDLINSHSLKNDFH